MAASGNSRIRELTKCSICKKVFSNPKLLPCTHMFCCQCLQGVWQTAGYGSNIRCPLCRQQHDVPPGGVNDLPNNLFVTQFLDIQRAGHSKEEMLTQLEEMTKTVRGIFEDNERRQQESTRTAEEIQELRAQIEQKERLLNEARQKETRVNEENNTLRQENAKTSAELRRLRTQFEEKVTQLTEVTLKERSANREVETLKLQIAKSSAEHRKQLEESSVHQRNLLIQLDEKAKSDEQLSSRLRQTEELREQIQRELTNRLKKADEEKKEIQCQLNMTTHRLNNAIEYDDAGPYVLFVLILVLILLLSLFACYAFYSEVVSLQEEVNRLQNTVPELTSFKDAVDRVKEQVDYLLQQRPNGANPRRL